MIKSCRGLLRLAIVCCWKAACATLQILLNFPSREIDQGRRHWLVLTNYPSVSNKPVLWFPGVLSNKVATQPKFFHVRYQVNFESSLKTTIRVTQITKGKAKKFHLLLISKQANNIFDSIYASRAKHETKFNAHL